MILWLSREQELLIKSIISPQDYEQAVQQLVLHTYNTQNVLILLAYNNNLLKDNLLSDLSIKDTPAHLFALKLNPYNEEAIKKVASYFMDMTTIKGIHLDLSVLLGSGSSATRITKDNCVKSQEGVLTLPADTTEIDSFSYYMDKTVYILKCNSKLKIIGESALAATNLHEIYFDEDLSIICDYGLDLTYVEHLHFLKGLRYIGDYGCAHNDALQTILFDNGVSSLGIGALAYNSSLRELELPKTCTKIKDELCAYNISLESFTAHGLMHAGKGTLKGNRSLRRVDFGQFLVSLGDETFVDNVSLEEVYFPSILSQVSIHNLADIPKTTKIYIRDVGNIDSSTIIMRLITMGREYHIC